MMNNMLSYGCEVSTPCSHIFFHFIDALLLLIVIVEDLIFLCKILSLSPCNDL
jgi:hypothetical protein